MAQTSRIRSALGSVLGITLAATLLLGVTSGAASADPVDSCFLFCSPVTTVPPEDQVPAPAPQPAPVPATPSVPTTLPPLLAVGTVGEVDGAAGRLLQMINADRARAGLAALSGRSDVERIASGHSRRMLAQRRLWHNDDYFTASTRNALGATALGENVAFNADLADMHRRLMNSPGHRANILDGRFQVVGISVVTDAAGILYATQDFLRPRLDTPVLARPSPPIVPVIDVPRTAARPRLATTSPPAALAVAPSPPPPPAPERRTELALGRSLRAPALLAPITHGNGDPGPWDMASVALTSLLTVALALGVVARARRGAYDVRKTSRSS